MSKRNLVLTAVFLSAFCLTLNAAPNNNSSNASEKYRIMSDDNIDNTDTLTIPLDDSEVEDEMLINYSNKKEDFDVPQRK